MNIDDLTFAAPPFLAKVLDLTTEDAVQKGHKILEAMSEHRSFFTDYEQGDLAKQRVAGTLMAPKAICWEVWDMNSIDLIGILRLSDVTVGCDATAHYFFFDSRLKDKVDLFAAWKTWLFTDHGDWKALKRLTVKVPSHAFALARHATKKLGFGGPFKYTIKNITIPVEGVKQQALLFDGSWHDMLMLGLHNN